VTAAEQAVDRSDEGPTAAAAAGNPAAAEQDDASVLQVPQFTANKPVLDFSSSGHATTTATSSAAVRAGAVASDAVLAGTAGAAVGSPTGEVVAKSLRQPARVVADRPDLAPTRPAGGAFAGGIVRPVTLPSMRSWMDRGFSAAADVAAPTRCRYAVQLLAGCCASAIVGVRPLVVLRGGLPSAVAAAGG